jgi:hypothetical protein
MHSLAQAASFSAVEPDLGVIQEGKNHGSHAQLNEKTLTLKAFKAAAESATAKPFIRSSVLALSADVEFFDVSRHLHF